MWWFSPIHWRANSKDIDEIVANTKHATASASELADNLDKRTAEITVGVNRLTATATRQIEIVGKSIVDLTHNPQRFLFGGGSGGGGGASSGGTAAVAPVAAPTAAPAMPAPAPLPAASARYFLRARRRRSQSKRQSPSQSRRPQGQR